jgi:transcriptional regulator with XRE-family HTH domain
MEPGPSSRRAAANLRRIRQERGLSYAELARRLAKTGHPILDTGLLKIEKGERRIDVDDLAALAVALDVTPNRLLLPEMDIEHAADPARLTPSVQETPPALWAWATGEAPLGQSPATAAAESDERAREVVFSRENRPHRWAVPPPPRTAGQSVTLTGLAALVADAFRQGISTDGIRSAVEGGIVAALSSFAPASGATKIEVTSDGKVTVRLNYAGEAG